MENDRKTNGKLTSKNKSKHGKLPDADLYTAEYTVPEDLSAEEFIGEKSDWSEDVSQENEYSDRSRK